jgi:flagellar biosynthesis anti-sigma factor FlgM
MRIDGYSPNWIETNISKVERQDRADVGTSRSDSATDRKPLNDDCSISASAMDGTAVNRARVEELRAQIAEGSYKLSPENIADAMLKSMPR